MKLLLNLKINFKLGEQQKCNEIINIVNIIREVASVESLQNVIIQTEWKTWIFNFITRGELFACSFHCENSHNLQALPHSQLLSRAYSNKHALNI